MQLQQTGPLRASHTTPGAAGNHCSEVPSAWGALPPAGDCSLSQALIITLREERFPPGSPSAASITGQSQSLINLFIYYVSLARLETPSLLLDWKIRRVWTWSSTEHPVRHTRRPQSIFAEQIERTPLPGGTWGGGIPAPPRRKARLRYGRGGAGTAHGLEPRSQLAIFYSPKLC